MNLVKKKMVFEKEIFLSPLEDLEIFTSNTSTQSPNGKYLYVGTHMTSKMCKYIFILDIQEGTFRSKR